MTNVKLYSVDEVCKKLKITPYTLENWYRYETKLVDSGEVKERYLPKPIKLEHTKGSPRRWNEQMILQLKNYQKTIVFGRNGIYGKYSNPLHKQTKKYQKQMEEQNE